MRDSPSLCNEQLTPIWTAIFKAKSKLLQSALGHSVEVRGKLTESTGQQWRSLDAYIQAGVIAQIQRLQGRQAIQEPWQLPKIVAGQIEELQLF